MKFLGTACIAILLCGMVQSTEAQLTGSRIPFAGRNLFINGINIAWVNWAADLGPSPVNVAQFQTEFQTVHNNGGNVLRLWLHTNGTNTPVFNAQGYVTGPGPVALQNLSQILDLAQENEVGLILCLWSHDMLNQSQMDTALLHRNARLLTDTAYTNSYIKNALIPMVNEVAGHPAIVAWEIFNEPEGITNEFGWSGRDHVPMESIQRCVNLMTGAIHRIDPTALVTSSANRFQTLTDANIVASVKVPSLQKLGPGQASRIVEQFNASHRLHLTVEEYGMYLERVNALANTNYYRDDRLIAAGGDPLGTLDFYCAHYYADSPGYSPFTHPFSYWGLTKPTIIGEFFMQATDGVQDVRLIPTLYDLGYAGALVWSWTDFNATNSAADTWTSLKYMLDNHRKDISITPTTGSIYSFCANPSTIEKTDSTWLVWDVEAGSSVMLNGVSVASSDSIHIAPLSNTSYTLQTSGEVAETSTVTISVLPSGKILAFSITPVQIGPGEKATVAWHVVKNSSVTLNGAAVPVVNSVTVYPDELIHTYTLIAEGDERDSATVSVQILPPDQVDRALGAAVSVSSNDTDSYSLSKPENMVDGNEATRWQSAAAPAGQYVTVDLGRTDTVRRVRIRWGNQAYAKQYQIRISDASGVWKTMKTVSNGTGGTGYVETFDNLNGVGRYVRLQLISSAQGAGYSIADFSIYGAPAVTGIGDMNDGTPDKYSLFQNFPNPFNPTTSISFSLIESGTVRLTIYNVLGQIVDIPVNARMNPGYHSVSFDASRLSSGVYYYRLVAGTFVSTKKMLLLK